MQVLYPYYVKKKIHESKVALTDVWLYLKFWAQLIDYKTIDSAFISYIFYCYFALNQNGVVQ